MAERPPRNSIKRNEIVEALQRMRDGDESASPAGPISKPVDRFGHLPLGTREWLESLREEDLLELREAIRFQRSAKTIGRFGRALMVTIVTVFITAVTLGEKIVASYKWLINGATK